MPDKSGSNRIGFNRRGPGVKEQIENARNQSEILDPDSDYWKFRTYQSIDYLVSCMGASEFEEWAERLFPADSIDQISWKEIHEAYDQKFQRVQAEIAMVDGRDWEDDPRHIKTNGVF
jgi:hypothetical protein